MCIVTLAIYQVKYNPLMDLLTVAGFLAALQGAPCNQIRNEFVSIQHCVHLCSLGFFNFKFFQVVQGLVHVCTHRNYFGGIVLNFDVKISQRVHFPTNVPGVWVGDTVHDACAQVRTLRKGCLWWVAPPCSTWIYLARGSTGRTFTRARGTWGAVGASLQYNTRMTVHFKSSQTCLCA